MRKKIIRIKMGVTAPFTDEEGKVWEADHGFADGDTTKRDSGMPITGTKTPSLYRTERYGMTAFSRPLASVKYTVMLHFAETYDAMDSAGLRMFSFNVACREYSRTWTCSPKQAASDLPTWQPSRWKSPTPSSTSPSTRTLRIRKSTPSKLSRRRCSLGGCDCSRRQTLCPKAGIASD